MRIWSLHPKYLDQKGLTACWRETLLAKHVLENKTKGYKNHPQLDRFKSYSDPLFAINFYLSEIYKEAKNRNYNYSIEKFDNKFLEKSFKLKSSEKIGVTDGQISYELAHLYNKLKIRDQKKLKENKGVILKDKNITPHPLFKIKGGDVERWERV